MCVKVCQCNSCDRKDTCAACIHNKDNKNVNCLPPLGKGVQNCLNYKPFKYVEIPKIEYNQIREILFKAKRVDNGEWVEGAYYKQTEWYGDPCEHHYIITSKDELEDNMMIYHEILPETLCEYTGLHDKNGKRIWENDIVHLTDVRYDTEWRAIVEFGNPYGEYTWGWNFYHIGKKAKVNTDILLWAEMEDVEVYCEVIGNRFDNAELLTAKRSENGT